MDAPLVALLLGALLLLAALAVGLELQRRAGRRATEALQSRLEGSEALLRAAFEGSPVAMAFFTPDGRPLGANRAARELLDVELGRALLDGPLVRYIHPEDEGRARDAFARALRGGADETGMDFRWVRSDGRIQWTRATFSAVRHPDGQVRFVVGTMEFVVQRGEADERIRQLAFFDDVTGLGNRSYLVERLDAALVRARESQHPLGVLFLDLDGFKQVNDALGHEAGDEVLMEAAQRFAACVRLSGHAARFGDELHLSRFGGDEFVMLLPAVDGARDCAAVANRVLTSLEAPLEVRGEKVALGVSIGIALYPDDGQNVPELLRAADDAMYVAKARTGSSYAFFHETRRRTAGGGEAQP